MTKDKTQDRIKRNKPMGAPLNPSYKQQKALLDKKEKEKPGPTPVARASKDDEFTKDAKTFKKFVEASRAAKIETAKDKVSPMKAQRLFMDTSRYRQKANVKKMFETGADPKTGEKLKTKVSLDRIKSTFKDRPKLLKEKVEDFYKPFEQKRNLAKGGRAGFKSGMRVCKLAKKGKGKAYGKNS